MRTYHKTVLRFLHFPLLQCISLYRHVQSLLATCLHSSTRPETSNLSDFWSRGRLTCFCFQQGQSPCPSSVGVIGADSVCIRRFSIPACSSRIVPGAWHFWPAPTNSHLACYQNFNAPLQPPESHFARQLACFAWSWERVSCLAWSLEVATVPAIDHLATSLNSYSWCHLS